MAELTVPMLAPDGKTIGDVPVANQAEALAKGFTLAPEKSLEVPAAPPLGTIPVEIQDITHEGKTPLVHLQSGKIGDVPVENAPAALATKQFRLPTKDELYALSDEAATNKRAEEIEKTGEYTGGLTGIPAAVLTGLAKGAPGYQIAEAIHQHDIKNKPVEQVAETQAAEKLGDEHPYAELLGRIPSEIASAYALSAIGESGAGAAGLTGLKSQIVQGAFYGLEPAVASVIANQDNPKEAALGAAEDLALGAIGNVALHGLFEYAGKGINNLIGRAETKAITPLPQQAIEEKQRVAVNTIAKSLGVPPASMEKAAKVIPDLINSKVLERTDTLETAIKKVQALEESGPAIGKTIEKLDAANGKELVISSELAKAYQKVTQLAGDEFLTREKLKAQLGPAQAEARAAKLAFEKADTEYGNELQKASAEQLENPDFLKNLENQYNVIKEHHELTEAVVKGIQGQLKEKLSPSARQAEKALRPILDEINSVAKKGSFKDTQALKKFVGEQTNWNKDNLFANDLRKRAYGIVRESLINAEDQAAHQLQSPEILQALQQNRAQYAWHKVMENFVDKTANKEVMHSTLDQLAHMPVGRHGLAGFIGHTLLGPLGSVGGIATSLGLTALKNYTREHAVGVAVGAWQDAPGLIAKASAHQQNKLIKAAKETMSFLKTQKRATPTISAAVLRQGIDKMYPGRGTSKQQLDSLRQAVTLSQSNPAALADHLATVMQPLHEAGLSEVAQAYTDHQLRLMKVLQTILPKDPSLSQAHPFSTNVKADEISPATKTRYERALSIAANPEVLLERIKNNTISKLDVAIAAATNPMTLQKLRDALLDEALKSKPNLSYQQQLSMDIMMGTNLEQSTTQLPVLQSVYAPVAPVTPPGNSKQGGSKSHLSAKSQDNLDESALTTSQKAMNI